MSGCNLVSFKIKCGVFVCLGLLNLFILLTLRIGFVLVLVLKDNLK